MHLQITRRGDAMSEPGAGEHLSPMTDVEKSKLLKDEAKERVKAATDDDKSFSERLHLLNPQMEEKQRNAFQLIDEQLRDEQQQSKKTVDDASKQRIIDAFKQSQTSQEQAMVVLQQYSLSDEQKNEILGQLPSAPYGQKEEMTDAEAEENGAVIEAVRDQAKEIADATNADLDNQLKEPDITEEDKKRIVSSKERVSRLLGRITNLFAEDTPGRTWARRIGKGLYVAAVVLFLIVILEMNLINKSARKK